MRDTVWSSQPPAGTEDALHSGMYHYVGLAIAGGEGRAASCRRTGSDPGRGTLSNSSLCHHDISRRFRHPSNRRSVRPPHHPINLGCLDTGIIEKKRRTATVPKSPNQNRMHGMLGSSCMYCAHRAPG